MSKRQPADENDENDENDDGGDDDSHEEEAGCSCAFCFFVCAIAAKYFQCFSNGEVNIWVARSHERNRADGGDHTQGGRHMEGDKREP